MPRLEFECQLSVPVDGYGIDDREPKPVIKLREGLSVLRQFEHKAANVLGLGFPLCLHRLELFQLGLGGFVPLRQTVVTFQIPFFVRSSLIFARINSCINSSFVMHS